MTGRVLFLMATSLAAWAQLPNVPPGSIVNGASFAAGQPITPGSLISIFGTNLSSSLQHASTVPLSKSLGGVTVHFINGSTTLDAPMLDTIPAANQLNLQVPWNIVPPNAPQQPVSVVVETAAGSSQPTAVLMGPFSPGIFAAGSLGIVQNNSDFTLAQPAGSIPGLPTHPAKHGDVLIIWSTGMGAVGSPGPPPDGAPAGNQIMNALTLPTVLIGGISAPVISSALSPQFVGVYQVAITVPDSAPAGNSVPIQIMIGGITSPASVTMAISQ